MIKPGMTYLNKNELFKVRIVRGRKDDLLRDVVDFIVITSPKVQYPYPPFCTMDAETFLQRFAVAPVASLTEEDVIAELTAAGIDAERSLKMAQHFIGAKLADNPVAIEAPVAS